MALLNQPIMEVDKQWKNLASKGTKVHLNYTCTVLDKARAAANILADSSDNFMTVTSILDTIPVGGDAGTVPEALVSAGSLGIGTCGHSTSSIASGKCVHPAAWASKKKK